jgi:thiol:disulfide interchange protein
MIYFFLGLTFGLAIGAWIEYFIMVKKMTPDQLCALYGFLCVLLGVRLGMEIQERWFSDGRETSDKNSKTANPTDPI